ncbi:MAG: DUF2577 family protein [Clostridiaceae bacterium]|nr:DUF2577 family protein [Clostridiaceae bacterium]
MSDVFETIKQTAVNAVEATFPVKLIFGIVQSTSPLKIAIDQKLSITSTQCVWLQGVGLAVGDRVALLRQQGGQQFLILGVLQ